MHRFVTPVIFGALTAYLWYFNGTNTDRQLLLPFIDVLFASEAHDSAALGQRSVQGGVVLTVLATIWAIGGTIRALRPRADDAAA